MDIVSSAAPAEKAKVDLLALVVHEDTLVEDAAIEELDKATGGALRRAIAAERFKGRPGQLLSLPTLGKAPAGRVLLVGAGARSVFRPVDLRAAGGRIARAGAQAGAQSIAVGARAPGAEAAAAQALTEGILLGSYRFDKYLSEDKKPPAPIVSATLHTGSDAPDAVARGRVVATAVARARDLVNEPAGVMTPSKLAAFAHDLAREHGLEVEILGREECLARNMGLFLAVSQGSAEPPAFIHLAWKPAGAKKRIAFVGKGVTFDSGGLSLKPNDSMLDMKVDMSGAAAVIAAIAAVADEKLPVEVHAIAACTENMPGGRAYKLGDVLRSTAGKTVEINNTDAEGRLTLADAITFALELKPDAVFDLATLTGACMVALGPHVAGVMSNNEPLAAEWLAAAKAAGEDMWPLPLPERLLEMLKSEVADMRNTGERWGGALTAGLFLKEFAGTTPWVHTDIAGPASTDKEFAHVGKGGTGFGVSTIVEYIRRLA